MANNKSRYTFIEFIQNYSIRIPLIQRDYVQGREYTDEKKLEKRQEYVYKYQHDETCLVAILSITACYTGITLTSASTVVFSELHMTPAVMIQAEDRAHRIGQEHECVNIHYLYGPDTIDEVLFKMLNQKQNIFSNTLDNMVKNMEVKNTYKKIGDFQKGREDLDVNINSKKLIITESGNKNMTLNNFVFIYRIMWMSFL